MKRKAIFAVFVLSSIFLITSCELTKEQELRGIVSEVRVVNTIKDATANNKSADAALGALLGGWVTGGIGGAAIGAAVGADGKQPSARFIFEPSACKFFANVSGQRLEFTITGLREYVSECALLKGGDTIRITKQIDGQKISYFWGKPWSTQGFLVPE